MCSRSGLCVLCALGFRMYAARLRCGANPCARWLHQPKPDVDCLTLEADTVASPSGSKRRLKRRSGASALEPHRLSPHGRSPQSVSCYNTLCRPQQIIWPVPLLCCARNAAKHPWMSQSNRDTHLWCTHATRDHSKARTGSSR